MTLIKIWGFVKFKTFKNLNLCIIVFSKKTEFCKHRSNSVFVLGYFALFCFEVMVLSYPIYYKRTNGTQNI